MADRITIHSVEDARRLARRRLPGMIFNFFDGGAGSESSLQLNQTVLQALRLQPRVLVNVEQRSLAREFLGHIYSVPFGVAPMGMAGLSWAGADQHLARAAAINNIPVGVSTASSMSLEQYQERAAGNAWFQLYFSSSIAETLSLAKRAAAAGYSNLVFTVDTPILSHRPRELGAGFKVPFKLGFQQFTDCALHPHWSLSMLAHGVPHMANFSTTSKKQESDSGFNRNVMRGGLDFAFLDKLRAVWPGKLIVKGVTAVPDARRIQDSGADAIWISTHGGRQLDSAPAAITTLTPIREAVGPAYPLVFDSGVRSGDGIVKALAMGADFVMLGRPFLYALAAGGKSGLAQLINLLTDDISRALAQIGLTDVNDLDQSVVVKDQIFRDCSNTAGE
ncbi:MAG: alpha-hydroxy acid oxidase [Burkholderiaceae bacterium]